MADCTDSTDEKLSAAFPSKLTEASDKGLQVSDCGSVQTQGFDMNVFLQAAQNYVKLNEIVNNLIGAEVRWFRAVPQQRSKDVILNEYTLSNVDDTPICLKVVVPDGNFPDSRYNYDMMGLEYEVPLEVQIDKGYWESKAGRRTAPQRKDIVYFSVPNKLYQVESSYLFRGFMEQETAWKVNLRKYSPEASRKEGEVLKQTIDAYTSTTEEMFGDMINKDINKIANDRQNSPYNSTTRDKYKVLDPSLSVIPMPLEVWGIRVAQSYYDLSTPASEVAVTYNISDKMTFTDDRSYTAWVTPSKNTTDEYDVNSISPSDLVLDANYKFTCPFLDVSTGDVVNVYRQGSINLYARFVKTVGVEHYFYIEPTVEKSLVNIREDWYNLKNFKLKVDEPINLISGFSDSNDLLLSLDVYAGQYISFRFSDQNHVVVLPDKLVTDDWYGIVLNMGNSWNQFNLYVWKKNDDDSADKLSVVYYETLSTSARELQVNEYSVGRSNALITNVRYYNATIEEEKQSEGLLSYFIKDGDGSLIADNCDPRYESPYIGRQR